MRKQTTQARHKTEPRKKATSSPPAKSGLIELPPPSEPISLHIEHGSLEDKTYSRLRDLILKRHISPGERIHLDRLSREMGVSRTPLVVGLKRLAYEHAVEFVPRRGIFVKRLTKREIARVFEVREVLEGLSARRAAMCISLEEVDQLTEMFKGLDLSETPEARTRYIDQDRCFHLRLVELAGNQPLAQAINAVNLMVFTYQMGLARPPRVTIHEHFRILDALRRRDPEASEAEMRLHMRRSMERMDEEADQEEAALQQVRSSPSPDAGGTGRG